MHGCVGVWRGREGMEDVPGGARENAQGEQAKPRLHPCKGKELLCLCVRASVRCHGDAAAPWGDPGAGGGTARPRAACGEPRGPRERGPSLPPESRRNWRAPPVGDAISHPAPRESSRRKWLLMFRRFPIRQTPCPRVPGPRGGGSTAAGERAPVPRCNGAELSPVAAKRRGQDPGGPTAAHGASGPPAPIPRLLFARRGWKAVRKRVRSTKRAERLPPACCGQRRTQAHDTGWERGDGEPGASSPWGLSHPGVFC